jgi:hypothetical protein
MKTLKNKNIIVVGVILLILIVGGFILTQSRGGSEKSKADSLPDVEVIPTVGPEVKVSLEADSKKHEVTMEIAHVPDGTESIEYEFSYTKILDGESIQDGAIGTIQFDGDDPISRDITLGTCSAKVCKYHEGVKKINVALKFHGKYGAQLFHKEFGI